MSKSINLVATLFILACAFLMLYTSSQAQCVNGQCYLPAVKAVVKAADNPFPVFKWRKHSAEQIFLEKDGKIVGQWSVPNEAYYAWDGTTGCGVLAKPPINPPTLGYGAAGDPDELKRLCESGVMNRQFNHRVTLSGVEINPDHVASAFENKLDDDSGKGYFTVLAKDATARAKVVTEWNKLPDDFKARYNLWAVPTDHFSVNDRFNKKPLFYTEGDPTIILQNSKGEVLFRRPQAGLQYAAADFGDLIKSDPNYNPKLDPGGPKPAPAPIASPGISTQVVTAGVVSLLGIGLVALRRKS